MCMCKRSENNRIKLGHFAPEQQTFRSVHQKTKQKKQNLFLH